MLFLRNLWFWFFDFNYFMIFRLQLLVVVHYRAVSLRTQHNTRLVVASKEHKVGALQRSVSFRSFFGHLMWWSWNEQEMWTLMTQFGCLMHQPARTLTQTHDRGLDPGNICSGNVDVQGRTMRQSQSRSFQEGVLCLTTQRLTGFTQKNRAILK